jgi:hypothetical protein
LAVPASNLVSASGTNIVTQGAGVGVSDSSPPHCPTPAQSDEAMAVFEFNPLPWLPWGH